MEPRITTLLLFIFHLIFSQDVFASSDSNTNLKTYIEKSDLIVHFRLLDKTSTEESMLKNFSMIEDGKVVQKEMISKGIYTTYTLEIIEVMSGILDAVTLEVKMSGGCYRDICATLSIGYDYKINEEGVLFLKYDKTSGNYFSYAAFNSAYKVGKNDILYLGENEPSNENKSALEALKEAHYLTLNNLREQVLNHVKGSTQND
ncbi:hypothetical protein [Marinicella meishanensis]|uniref:hypothetical protein n=1 Tax=Marinicella meishanensis TaxID=2873263 RepID=UPI001CC18673|nr:hypothetical protein [Marinicella sp. NBU2979]